MRGYRPGQSALDLPRKLGPAQEIQELRDAFARAIARVDESEREMAGALEGQRRLVREVHHRVKNNLQVIASLLNIHGAEREDRRSTIGLCRNQPPSRRALDRPPQPFRRDGGKSRDRAAPADRRARCRASGRRAGRSARLGIELDIETVYTTQDAAVAVAFLITEIVEFAMLNAPQEPVELSLRRTSELTARLTLTAASSTPDEEEKREKIQFERIIGGLAKQLRSSLDRKLGRYSVDLPVFPAGLRPADSRYAPAEKMFP